MNTEIEERIEKIPILRNLVRMLKRIKLPWLAGLSFYDLLELYILGIIEGALTYHASAVAFSFFMALFPFALFILNLIPYIPIEGFQQDLHRCEGVICSAGFELPSEAIQLGKKLLVQPVAGQMEQQQRASVALRLPH